MSNIRRWRYAGLLIGVLLLALVVWKWSDWRARAQVGAAYGARMTCSCRYVEGRDIGSCRGDIEPGMVMVSITDDPQDKIVRASVPAMASRTARFRPGFGCLLDAD